MKRTVNGVVYWFSQKEVRHINLRVRRDGSVHVSAGRRVPLSDVDAFVAAKKDWILRAQAKIQAHAARRTDYTDEACKKVFEPISDRIYPLFAPYLNRKPEIKIKTLKSSWGICHYRKGYITLNRALLSMPIQAIEYVILHEYIHFLEPNHQAGFYARLEKLMPDYKERKKLLK